MTTPSFLTIASGAPRPIAVWSGDLRVLAYHTEASLPDDLAKLPRWRFTVPVTQIPRSEANRTGYPVLDQHHRPLWKGARITARFGKSYESVTDTGIFQFADAWMMMHIQSDSAHRKYGLDPRIGEHCLPPSRGHSVSRTEYMREGVHPESLRIYGTVGSHEHGFTEHYITLDEDPRGVCVRARRPRRAPSIAA